MNELIKVNYESEEPTVSGRELHEFLEVKTAYKDWMPRMCEYGFIEGKDYCSFLSHGNGFGKASTRTDHALTIPMAKEICMLQRTERGKQARQYFISLEVAWNTPDAVMARALKLADKQLAQLKLANAQLTVQNQIMAPKAEYFDELVERNLLTSFRETAKEIGVKERIFVGCLIDWKYIFRDKKGKLMPYADKNNGLFEVKECFNEKTQWSGTQTLITPKGRETFRLLFQGMVA